MRALLTQLLTRLEGEEKRAQAESEAESLAANQPCSVFTSPRLERRAKQWPYKMSARARCTEARSLLATK